MNNKKAKWLRKLIEKRNPVLLLLIRNNYGESTQGMDYKNLFRAAKKLYKKGEMKKIKGWPTINEMRKMKGELIFDEALTRRTD